MAVSSHIMKTRWPWINTLLQKNTHRNHFWQARGEKNHLSWSWHWILGCSYFIVLQYYLLGFLNAVSVCTFKVAKYSISGYNTGTTGAIVQNEMMIQHGQSFSSLYISHNSKNLLWTFSFTHGSIFQEVMRMPSWVILARGTLQYLAGNFNTLADLRVCHSLNLLQKTASLARPYYSFMVGMLLTNKLAVPTEW